MKRRTFLKTTSAVAATALTASLARPLLAMPEDSEYLDTIGLQLWTVRNQMAKDKKATLKAVADAGYHQVELMDVLDGKELLPICKDLGLKVTSAFMNWQSICNPSGKDVPSLEEIVEAAHEYELEHLVFGYVGKGHRETADDYKKMADACNELGESCNKHKIQLCYHNHAFEFEKIGELKSKEKDKDGKIKDDRPTGFDLFMEHFDNEKCKFELDVFWALQGGWDPIETLEKLDGRVTQVHLKDLIKDADVIYDEGKVPKKNYQALGDGVIDMAEVLKVSKKIGVQQCHVEQDESEDPLKSINKSIKHLHTLG